MGSNSILKRVGNVVYEFDLPRKLLIHLVFHVNLLTFYIQLIDPSFQLTSDRIQLIEGQPVYKVESILDSRVRRYTKDQQTEYVVVWKCYPFVKATWNQSIT